MPAPDAEEEPKERYAPNDRVRARVGRAVTGADKSGFDADASRCAESTRGRRLSEKKLGDAVEVTMPSLGRGGTGGGGTCAS